MEQSALSSRRGLLQLISAAGVGTTVFQRALADEAAKTGELTAEGIAAAEWIAGMELTAEERQKLAASLPGLRNNLQKLRSIACDFSDLPALRFDPEAADPGIRHQASVPRPWLVPAEAAKGAAPKPAPVSVPGLAPVRGGPPATGSVPVTAAGSVPVTATGSVPATATGSVPATATGSVPATADDLSWLSIRTLAGMLRAGQITSEQLTRHCLDRLMRYDQQLNCVVTLTEDLAIAQARAADRELSQGIDRGLLHGIPWGAKDLLSVAGYATTWGVPQFRERQSRATAAAAARLEAAGAVLVAKLSTGALAMGDQWFLGQTRNPWNIDQGSSGSSAGSASAVAAGLVPFAIGSETLGSIISPARRCGTTGLRPTFGRISRAGCMALTWSMDKLGPLARTCDDCGIVLAATHGADPADPCSVDRWFAWPMEADLSKLRVGRAADKPIQPPDQAALDHLQALGAQIVDVQLPRDLQEWATASMLDVEAACIFREWTNQNITEGLNVWPAIFRKARFMSAVDYMHAARVRFRLMQAMAEVFRKVDIYVGGDDLGITNLTGHPSLALPVIMQDKQPQTRPECCTLTSGLYDEATLLALGRLIEERADVIRFRPEFRSTGSDGGTPAKK
ncbi:MAG: Glutamyl-tRNA(Gln) amidotransferase subunit [Planctomycetota bacterium]